MKRKEGKKSRRRERGETKRKREERGDDDRDTINKESDIKIDRREGNRKIVGL